MSNQKNEWDFQDDVTKKELKTMYDALKCANIPLSTGHNAGYGLEDVVLVLPHMCKNWTTANRSVTELCIVFRDDKNARIPTSRWLLGITSAIDHDKMDVLCRRMLKSTIKNGYDLEKKTGHMRAIDKYLIPFTGAAIHHDSFVISGRPKGGTYQFRPDCAAFLGSTTPMTTMSTGNFLDHILIFFINRYKYSHLFF